MMILHTNDYWQADLSHHHWPQHYLHGQWVELVYAINLGYDGGPIHQIPF